MATTRRCRCWRRAAAGPKRDDCGPMFVTSGRLAAPGRRRQSSSTRRIAKGKHPRAHLEGFIGVLHADGYAGFNGLFETGRISEAGCWAHVRRKFFDVHAATTSPIAKEALDRIGQLYAVETTINGAPPVQRQQQRNLRSKPLAEALAAWTE